MAKYLVEFDMDGYDDETEMAKQGVEAIYDSLNSSGTSVKVTLLSERLAQIAQEVRLPDEADASVIDYNGGVDAVFSALSDGVSDAKED